MLPTPEELLTWPVGDLEASLVANLDVGCRVEERPGPLGHALWVWDTEGVEVYRGDSLDRRLLWLDAHGWLRKQRGVSVRSPIWGAHVSPPRVRPGGSGKPPPEDETLADLEPDEIWSVYKDARR